MSIPVPRHALALASILLGPPTLGQAQHAADRLPVDAAVVAGRLPNGMRYFIRPNSRPAKRAELRLAVNAGSILEDDDQLGLAHFAEHMAFNGTRRFAKQELVDFLERIGMQFGADLNASTSFDETVYQLVVPTDSADLLVRGIEILEDWAHGVTFDPAEIEKERGVVIEEWRLGQGAGHRMLQRQLPVLFRGSRYADRLPIGTRESLQSFSPAALRRFYQDWYRPDLMAVVAVGDFDPGAVERLIREHLGRVPARSAPRPRADETVPARDSAAVAIASDREATSTSVRVYFLRPGKEDGTVASYRRSLVARLYAQMLNGRLQELSQRPNPPFIGAGGGEDRLVRNTEAFTLGAALADSAVRTGLEAVLVEAERVERHGFTAAELERARQDLLRLYEQAYTERDKTESVAFAEEYVRHFLTGEPIPGIAHEFELVKRLVPGITLEETNRAARDWFATRDRVLLVNAPAKPGVPLPSGADLLGLFEQVQGRDIAPYVETVSQAPLVAADLPAGRIVAEGRDSALGLTRWTLANGVRVIVKPTDFKADEVLLTAFSPGGTSLLPDSLFRNATFASRVVDLGGLGDFTAIELQKKLAGKVAQLGPYIGGYEEGLQGQASPRDLELLLQLVYLHFTAPRADPGAFDAFRANFRAAIANRSASPAVAFQDTLAVTLAQHHPRSRPLTAAVVDSLDLDRAIRVYRDRFADAGDFTFVVVGSFSLDSLRPLVERYLANLPALNRRERWRDVGIRPPTGRVEREVRRGIEPKSQTQLVISGGLAYSRTERFLLDALAAILDIKLREALREDLGGTYGVTVRATPSRVPREQYSLSIGFGSAPERVPELLRAVDAQIDSLREQGAAAKELEKVRETLVRSEETGLRQNEYWLARLAAAERNGDEAAGYLDSRDLLPLLTPERLRDAARHYLDRTNVVRVTLYPER
jgi:zinc protease